MLRCSLSLALPLLVGFAGVANDAAAVPPQIASLPVEMKYVEPIHALTLPMVGSYDQHLVALARLEAWMAARGIAPTGPAFGRYFNDAAQNTLPLWVVGFPVPDAVKPTTPFEAVDLPSHLVASLVCEGPYQDASQRWPLLIAWVVTHGYSISGAPMQVYTGEPDGTGARGPRTELRLPVERAE